MNAIIVLIISLVILYFIIYFAVQGAINNSKLKQDVELLKEMAALKWDMEIKEVDTHNSSTQQADEAQFQTCPNCHYVADSTYVYCPNCGEKLPK